ncbi:hypothetical protein TrST_g13283 [Triparma strigata]|uniref:Uncharacterized protein n=1 Tax=Triparma strigata TaxID=1606541 RepID=A0A9W7BF98_9STRA|nr:hypothetical protein TrST_g13283 [Triparma strigata]
MRKNAKVNAEKWSNEGSVAGGMGPDLGGFRPNMNFGAHKDLKVAALEKIKETKKRREESSMSVTQCFSLLCLACFHRIRSLRPVKVTPLYEDPPVHGGGGEGFGFSGNGFLQPEPRTWSVAVADFMRGLAADVEERGRGGRRKNSRGRAFRSIKAAKADPGW